MSSNLIINYLEMVSNNNLLINLLMHIVVLAALASIFVLKQENVRRIVFYTSISILLLSVTVNAAIFGNPFHGITFGLLALISVMQLLKNKENIQVTQNKMILVISLLFIFIGFWYPEFVNKNMLMMLAVSPVGIVPCPTLLTTLGLFTLVRNVNKTGYIIAVIIGLIYGVIGVFAFKVYLDITLLLLIVFTIYNYIINTRTNVKVSYSRI